MQYVWFNVDYNTPIDVIKKQYRQLAMEHHPDLGGNPDDMARINAEYNDLVKHHYNIHTSAKGSVYTDESQDAPDKTTVNFTAIIDKLIHMGLNCEVCGSWLWISGDTKPHKDELKQMGARWASKKKLWFIAGSEKRSKYHISMDKIRDLYGSSTYEAVPDGDHDLAAVR